MSRLLLLTFLVAAQLTSFAQFRKYSNEFLKIGVGAEPLAKAGAFVAQADGVYASYWNPAGLNSLTEREFGLMHAEYFAGIAKFDYLAAAMPLDDGKKVAFSLTRFAVDDIMNTSQLIDANGNIDYDRISLFTASDYAFNLSYAQIIKEKYSVGVNSKLIYRNIGSFANAIGFGFDVGAQTTFGKYQMGLLLRDVTSTFNAWFIDESEFDSTFVNTGNALPSNGVELTAPSVQWGVYRAFPIQENFNLDVEFDLLSYLDGERNELINAGFISLSPALGTSLSYQYLVFLRLGVGNFQRETNFDNSTNISFQPNLGLGIQYRNIKVDYAITDIGDQSTALYSNVFSLSLAL